MTTHFTGQSTVQTRVHPRPGQDAQGKKMSKSENNVLDGGPDRRHRAPLLDKKRSQGRKPETTLPGASRLKGFGWHPLVMALTLRFTFATWPAWAAASTLASAARAACNFATSWNATALC
jgi:hypothetical protein